MMKTRIFMLLSLLYLAKGISIHADEGYAVIADSIMTLYYDNDKSTRVGNVYTVNLDIIYPFNSVGRYIPSWYKSKD